MTIVSKHNAEHYQWGDQCDGWHLLKDSSLSVIQERVPPGKSEVRHFHHVAQQFFFILTGAATLEVAGVDHALGVGEGLHVAAHVPHRFKNDGSTDVEFLVISQPTTRGDRENMSDDD